MRLWMACFLLLGFFNASPALAKTVSLQWKPIPGAVRYEIELHREGAKPILKAAKEPQWKGEIPPGPYAYRLRAIDRVKRPGSWSETKPLIVMPPPPEPETPANGEVIRFFAPTQSVKFKWNPVNGAKKYRLEIRQGDKTVLTRLLENHETEIQSLPRGEYQWQVGAVLETLQKSWESASSELKQFSLEKQNLEAPALRSPTGTHWWPASRKISLEWEGVSGAEKYEVFLEQNKLSDRSPASTRKFETTASQTTITVPVPTDGPYRWGVRALAGTENSPASVANFKLERDLDSGSGGAGYVALSTMLAPYQYDHESPSFGQRVKTESQAATGRLSGEYWISRNFAASAGFDNTLFIVNQNNFNRLTYELIFKYSMKLGNERYGWFFAPKLGLEGRDYIALNLNDPNNPSSIRSARFTALGIAAGFDLRRQFSARWSVGVKASYFLPLSLNGGESRSTIASDSSYRNMNLGVQGLYWLSRSWGLGMGAYFDQRSIGYNLATAPSLAPDKVVMDAIYFFGSLIYNFGK